MTLLSVIMPNYNYGQYLREALDSILLHNTSSEYEILVIDDGSTDDSRTVLKPYFQNPKVQIVLQENNRGVAAAVNLGIAQAKGEFLHFFASDDLHLPGTVDVMIKMIHRFPHLSLFSADFATFNNPSQITSHRLLPCQAFSFFNPLQVQALFRRTHFWIPGDTVFIKKSVCLNYDPQLGPVCDWLNNHTLALERGVGYLPQTLVAMRRHPDTYSNTQTQAAKRQMWLYLLEQLEQNPDRYRPLVASGILRMLGIRAIYYDLLKKPKYWRYLYPMLRREIEKNIFNFSKSIP